MGLRKGICLSAVRKLLSVPAATKSRASMLFMAPEIGWLSIVALRESKCMCDFHNTHVGTVENTAAG